MSWQISQTDPWLEVRFAQPMECLGWTPQHGGQVVADRVLWRAVRDHDLTPELDVLPWLAGETAGQGASHAPCFLTARHLRHYTTAEATVEGITARALATAGLGNAEHIGARLRPDAKIGTINLLVMLDHPLEFAAKLEALSLMAEARTLAMVEKAIPLPAGLATGTGTDCLCLASPPSSGRLAFAGKHTALGEAVGRAARDALRQAITAWEPAPWPAA